MLERILTDDFRAKLKLTFMDIRNLQDKRDENEFAKDEARLRGDLIDIVEPYPSRSEERRVGKECTG